MKEEKETEPSKLLNFNVLPYNSTNPFVEQMIESVKTKTSKKTIGTQWRDVLDETTGELKKEQILVLGENKKVEKSEWYKMYYSSIASFYDLPKSCMKIFDYIMQNIQYASDKICLHPKKLSLELDLSIVTVYKALALLINRKLLAKADTPTCYYINPNIAFKGDRLLLIQAIERQ